MEMTVGEVAQRAGVKVSTLHFYEQKGLIHSWRNAGNQRRYHRNVLRRIAVIKAAQMVGLTLEEVAESLADLPKHQAPSRQEWEQMASNWNAMLEHRIAQLKALQNDLGGCIGCGCLSMESCAIYNPQDIRAQTFSEKTRLTHPEEW
ncbi:redox-sensitive transcriptional activator SoxR [Vibrio fluvialis]|jgi:MerR family redox-sensitive transcriptional activator SoxR|uniref:Redox-sensitive transcriptional activator SoxR n=4 Tax=Vibrio fluvialis TaxID=676 RepID=A0AAX2LS25_VIBFL|nr:MULTISPECIES: redox-sensitive transcriptional activator SoxR [Vibrio]HDM8036543.1 redox-sensitive transcriptional activator SoxR [Vibrio fluvialis clinical-1]AMF94695.1 redox-sensitive transcriptional activator SoxR [Vibrio fluvialis]EKO3367804.1 redox-sensitive transcriptional activator SoxR [Vibrio fluvialis]EKO3376415.1 redox-sensitive transcriptional activator SoxR [Vibrio fluvialis]EKO3380042.1 redox-sensitive transcriptional activator SoxR [Vibrio fluvialis]